jgi:hypothetical protein
VAPLVIALRMVHGLLAARLVELGYAPVDGELADDISGIERWIATLEPTLDAGLETLTGVALAMERNERADKAATSFFQFRSKVRCERTFRRIFSQRPAS